MVCFFKILSHFGAETVGKTNNDNDNNKALPGKRPLIYFSVLKWYVSCQR